MTILWGVISLNFKATTILDFLLVLLLIEFIQE